MGRHYMHSQTTSILLVLMTASILVSYGRFCSFAIKLHSVERVLTQSLHMLLDVFRIDEYRKELLLLVLLLDTHPPSCLFSRKSGQCIPAAAAWSSGMEEKGFGTADVIGRSCTVKCIVLRSHTNRLPTRDTFLGLAANAALTNR